MMHKKKTDILEEKQEQVISNLEILQVSLTELERVGLLMKMTRFTTRLTT